MIRWVMTLKKDVAIGVKKPSLYALIGQFLFILIAFKISTKIRFITYGDVIISYLNLKKR